MAVYLVTGTNRGIGLEFVSQLLARGEQVIATCRDADKAPELAKLDERHTNLEVLEMDVSKPDSLSNLPKRLEGRAIDVLINNAGVYGPRDAAFGQIKEGDWASTLHVNAIAPILLTQLMLPHLQDGKLKKLVFITSKMGSVADNSGGGHYIYRSSKAALNAAVKSLSIDLADAGFSVGLLHPGWVKTDMGGPNAWIDAQTSVSGMLKLIDALNKENSGRFQAYDGKSIPW